MIFGFTTAGATPSDLELQRRLFLDKESSSLVPVFVVAEISSILSFLIVRIVNSILGIEIRDGHLEKLDCQFFN